MGWVSGPDCPAWALPAGATGGYAVPAPDGAGPLLGGELTRGSFAEVDAEWLGLGRIELPPLGRYVVQWQWDWYPSPARFERGRFLSVPRQLVLRAGEVARITADDDEAVVARGVDLDPRRRRAGAGRDRSGSGAGPGELGPRRHRVRPHLGGVRLRRSWRRSAQPWFPGGWLTSMPRWWCSTCWLAVRPTIRRRPRTPWTGSPGGCWTRRRPSGRARSATSAPSSSAPARLRCWTRPTAGLLEVADADRRASGLAATHLCVAAMVAGRPVEDAARPPGRTRGDGRTRSGTGGSGRPAGAAGRRARSGEPSRARSGPRWTRCSTGSAWLGAGLRGRPVRPLPVDDLAHLSVVLGLLPEEVGAIDPPSVGDGPARPRPEDRG